MKTKKAPVIALTLIAIGIVVCIVSFGFGFNNSDIDFDTQSFEQSYDLNTNLEDITADEFSVKSINFDIDCGDIKIVEGDSFKLEVKDAIVDTVEQSVTNNTLIVTQHNPKTTNGKFSFNIFGHSVSNKDALNTVFTLTVPKGSKFINVDIKSNVGDMTAYELTCKNFSSDIDVGKVNIDNLTCEKTEIATNVGDVKLQNVNINDCDISSNVGDINIDGVITGKNTISTDVGDLDMTLKGNVDDYSFSVDKGIGDSEINNKKASLFENQSAPNTFDINHDVGDVDITIG